MADDNFSELPWASDGFMPSDTEDWQQLTGLPLRFGRWPYTAEELVRLYDALPAQGAAQARARATRDVILAAREFLHSAHLRQKYRVTPKADPRSELIRILHASRELSDAICAASDEAHEYLSNHLAPVAVKSPTTAQNLLSTLFWFEHDHRYAFDNPPERNVIGAPEKLREERLVYHLWNIWRDVHAFNPPTRGWPAFRSACAEPLAGARFPKEFRDASRTETAWQDLLRRARKRYERPKK